MTKKNNVETCTKFIEIAGTSIDFLWKWSKMEQTYDPSPTPQIRDYVVYEQPLT